MKRIGFLLLAVATLASIVVYMAHASRQSDEDSSPSWSTAIIFPIAVSGGDFQSVGHGLCL